MNTNQEKNSNKSTTGSPLIEFISVLVKYRYFLVSFILTITIVSTVYALVSPKWYKSTSVVLAAEQTDLLGGLSGISSLVKGFSASKGLASLTGNSETDRYLAILQSATIIDNTIKKFNLREVYDMEDDYYEKLVKEYQGNVETEVGDEGQLIISVFDKDKQRAADIANYLVMQLNEVNSKLHVQNAKANREFIEKRYFANLYDIDSLENAMKSFQEEYGVVAVPEQLQTTVTAMAALYGQLVEKQLELEVLQQSVNSNHPLVGMAVNQVRALENKIQALNKGDDKLKEHDVNLLIPFKQAPELAQKYLKIYRDLEVQYTILEFITPLYEQAKVEEVRNTPSVVVLDKAGPAERKAKPKGSLYAIVSFVLSTLIGLFLVYSMELLKKMKENDYNAYTFIITSIQSDLKKIRFMKRR